MTMKYFLIAGEASGDLHASNLMKALKDVDPGAEFRFMGGELMSEVGGERILHYRETAYMLADVFLHLRKIRRNMRRVRREVLAWKPDVLVPVDYPGFNLPLARFVARRGIRVFYYISPKVWVWNRGRIRLIRKYVDQLFSILPFEKEFFRGHRIDVEYFGNPLVDQVEAFHRDFEGEKAWRMRNELDERPIVALLAGSRIREIEGTLPAMLEVAGRYPDHQFVIAGAPSMNREDYAPLLLGSGVKLIFGQTYALLECARAGLVTSGTATLEAGLFGLPQVVLYRASPFWYRFGTLVINLGFISLVNLILGRESVRELIRKDLAGAAGDELKRLLGDDTYRSRMTGDYHELRGSLGDEGVSQRIAHRMLELIQAAQGK